MTRAFPLIAAGWLLVTQTVTHAGFFEDVRDTVVQIIILPLPIPLPAPPSVHIPTFDEVRENVEKATGVKVKVATPEEVTNGLGKLTDDAGRELNIFVSNISNEGNKGLENIGREVNIGIHNITEIFKKAHSDIGMNLKQSGKDVEANIAKSGRDVEEAAHAIGNYIERSAQDVNTSANNAETRIREGKFIDAMWHAALDPFQSTEKNAALAAQESSLVRTIGQTAASAYGGPQGAAAYAAWLAYKETGNADMAFRVGLITGLSSVAFAEAGKMPTGTAYEKMKKTVVVASLGATAIAAAGGSPEQIKQGFMAAGAMVLVQDHYKEVTKGHALDKDSMKASKDMPAYCSTIEPGVGCTPVPKDAIAKSENGRITELHMNKIDRRVPGVGIAGSSNVGGDNSATMKLVSKVPGMQGMSVMHDSWVTEARLEVLNAPTIIPAVVVYYTGTGAPFYDGVRKTAMEEMIVKQAQTDHKKPVSEPSTILVPAGSALSTAPSGNEATASLDLTPRQDAIKISYTCGAEGAWRQLVVEEAPDMKPKACRLFLKISQGLPDHPVRHEEAQRKNRKACAAKAASFIDYWSKENGFTCLALPGAHGK